MRRRWLLALVLVASAPATAHAATWTTVWASPMQGAIPVGYNTDPATLAALPAGVAADSTLRLATRASLGGSALRVRLSGAFDRRALAFDAVSVAVGAGGSALVPGTVRTVTFGGARAGEIPAGATLVSDPVALGVERRQRLVVS
ncbi:MAG: hypothetical protein QOG68_2020, partial [Solirubrobacteraceae bacterium]|nr:hypothetical protein [Solirubrobacteraceae bacterium]